MSSARFLDYEVALLLAKYGRGAVVNALARKLRMPKSEIEASLRKIDAVRQESSASVRTSDKELIETAAKRHPEKADQLRLLGSRFVARAFLTELRDVRRFFDQRSAGLGAVKSRAKCLPKLLSLLAEHSAEELDRLCEIPDSRSVSSLGIISDEILRRHG